MQRSRQYRKRAEILGVFPNHRNLRRNPVDDLPNRRVQRLDSKKSKKQHDGDHHFGERRTDGDQKHKGNRKEQQFLSGTLPPLSAA